MATLAHNIVLIANVVEEGNLDHIIDKAKELNKIAKAKIKRLGIQVHYLKKLFTEVVVLL